MKPETKNIDLEKQKRAAELEELFLSRLKRMQETAKNIKPASAEALEKASLKQHYVPGYNRSSNHSK